MALGWMAPRNAHDIRRHNFRGQILSCNGFFRYSPAMGHFFSSTDGKARALPERKP
jgi:hypothetical protein